MSTDDPAYLVIGHITDDLQADGSILPGGTALYAAVTALRLGLRVAVATAGQLHETTLNVLAEATLQVHASDRTTAFINRYDQGRRTQYLTEQAPPIDLAALPPGWRRASIIHLGPVAQEVPPEQTALLSPAWLCATPQGWLRQWEADGLVRLEPPRAALAVVPRVLVVSAGEEEAKSAALRERVLAAGGLVAVTQGIHGSTLTWADQRQHVPTYQMEEVDPTGAGDVYAAALFIRLAAGDAPPAAATFASATAALSTTGPGISAIPDEGAVRHLIATS